MYILLLHVFYAVYVYFFFVFFFKQKTAYEMRISDWSSDVCSSDLSGKDAHAFLDRVYANRMPKRDGGVVLAHWLNENGFIKGEATITRLGPDRFYLLSAAAAAARDKDMLLQRRRADEDVEIVDVTRERGCLVVAGSKSRDVLRNQI